MVASVELGCLEHDTLTCCHPDWTASGRIIFFLSFSESADIFFFADNTSRSKKRLLKPETESEILRYSFSVIQINEWLPAVVCVMNFGATIIQKPVKQNSPIVSK